MSGNASYHTRRELGTAKSARFYSHVTKSLRYFYGPFMTSLSPLCHTPQRQAGDA
jgi:hypothetical protein